MIDSCLRLNSYCSWMNELITHRAPNSLRLNVETRCRQTCPNQSNNSESGDKFWSCSCWIKILSVEMIQEAASYMVI